MLCASTRRVNDVHKIIPAAVGLLVFSMLNGARVIITVSSSSLRRFDGYSGFGLEVRMDVMGNCGTGTWYSSLLQLLYPPVVGAKVPVLLCS